MLKLQLAHVELCGRGLHNGCQGGFLPINSRYRVHWVLAGRNPGEGKAQSTPTERVLDVFEVCNALYEMHLSSAVQNSPDASEVVTTQVNMFTTGVRCTLTVV